MLRQTFEDSTTTRRCCVELMLMTLKLQLMMLDVAFCCCCCCRITPSFSPHCPHSTSYTSNATDVQLGCRTFATYILPWQALLQL